MFSSVEAVLVHLRWVAGDVLSGTNAGALLYNAASLGNSLACCGNWRSLRSKHQLPWWKMRRKSTKKIIYWYATPQRSKERWLLLHWWATASNYLSVCEIWCVIVRHLLRFHILDLWHLTLQSSVQLVNRQGFKLAQAHSNTLMETLIFLLMDQNL